MNYIKRADNFFNKAAQAIDKKYYPDVAYYRDNENTTKIHRSLELFNNGALQYDKLITNLSTACKDTEANIHAIISEFIEDFGDYNGKHKAN